MISSEHTLHIISPGCADFVGVPSGACFWNQREK